MGLQNHTEVEIPVWGKNAGILYFFDVHIHQTRQTSLCLIHSPEMQKKTSPFISLSAEIPTGSAGPGRQGRQEGVQEAITLREGRTVRVRWLGVSELGFSGWGGKKKPQTRTRVILKIPQSAIVEISIFPATASEGQNVACALHRE